MPRVSEIFSARFLKAENLQGQPRTIKIDGYGKENAYGEDVWVIYIADEQRALKLSATCAHDIAQVLSDDMDAWVGGEIEIYPAQQKITDKNTKEEKTVDMIRARAVKSPGQRAATAVLAAKMPAPKRGDLDDSIPF